MSLQMAKLLAAAECASGATLDMIAAYREGEIDEVDNVGSGETLIQMVDGVRLLIEAMDTDDEAIIQMMGACMRFLREEQ